MLLMEKELPVTEPKLLVVDDDPCVRELLSYVLAEIGYQVRTAEDGFSALDEIRREVPDVLLSDLNMPGMSGFELLVVVRSRFPAIQTVAMSSLFSLQEVPSSVVADAFYQKGMGVGLLLEIMQGLPRRDRVSAKNPDQIEPNLILGDGQDNLRDADGTISNSPLSDRQSLFPLLRTAELNERQAMIREAQ